MELVTTNLSLTFGSTNVGFDGTYYFVANLNSYNLYRSPTCTSDWSVIATGCSYLIVRDNRIVYKHSGGDWKLSTDSGNSWTTGTLPANCAAPIYLKKYGKWFTYVNTGSNPTVTVTGYSCDTFDGTWTTSGLSFTTSYGATGLRYVDEYLYIETSYGDTIIVQDAGESSLATISAYYISKANGISMAQSNPWPSNGQPVLMQGPLRYSNLWVSGFAGTTFKFCDTENAPYHLYTDLVGAPFMISYDGIKLHTLYTPNKGTFTGNSMALNSVAYGNGLFLVANGNGNGHSAFSRSNPIYNTVTY